MSDDEIRKIANEHLIEQQAARIAEYERKERSTARLLCRHGDGKLCIDGAAAKEPGWTNHEMSACGASAAMGGTLTYLLCRENMTWFDVLFVAMGLVCVMLTSFIGGYTSPALEDER